MSDIETEKFRQIGIDLINEYRQKRGIRLLDWLVIDTPEVMAFIRSIQLHEKTKQELADCKQELSDFRQEVSDALIDYFGEHLVAEDGGDALASLVIPAPKPDLLVRIINEVIYAQPHGDINEVRMADDLRAALDALGFEIREKNDEN
jgi:hypothetical protein